MKKFWKKIEGFTLVELIVVIAILGILAGIGTVGYSGYVKKANMAADQQLVAGIVNGIELERIVNAAGFPANAKVVLSGSDAVVTGTDSAAMAKIMENVYGTGWQQACKLKYGQWGLGSSVSTYAKSLATALGDSGSLSYKDQAGDLWDEVEIVLDTLQGNTLDTLYEGKYANLMNAAAGKTTTQFSSAADFATAWANPTGTVSFGATTIDKTTADALNPMLAQSAAAKARNYTFANYLKTNYPSLSAEAAAIEAYSTTLSGTDIPVDFFNAISSSRADVTNIITTGNAAELTSAINAYFGVSATADTSTAPYIKLNGASAQTGSQAYNDALGYYTLMQAVEDSYSETKSLDNDTYNQTVSDAVQNVVTLLDDDSLLEDVDGGCVVIMLRNNDGKIYITPSSIYAGGQDNISGGQEAGTELKSSVIVTLDGSFNGTVSNSLVLKVGTTGNIVLKPSDDFAEDMQEVGGDANAIIQSAGILNLIDSDAPSVASVTGGVVNALSAGNAVLTAKSGSEVLFTINVTVEE